MFHVVRNFWLACQVDFIRGTQWSVKKGRLQLLIQFFLDIME